MGCGLLHAASPKSRKSIPSERIFVANAGRHRTPHRGSGSDCCLGVKWSWKLQLNAGRGFGGLVCFQLNTRMCSTGRACLCGVRWMGGRKGWFPVVACFAWEIRNAGMGNGEVMRRVGYFQQGRLRRKDGTGRSPSLHEFSRSAEALFVRKGNSCCFGGMTSVSSQTSGVQRFLGSGGLGGNARRGAAFGLRR
jgi:hypothetical protein